MKDKINMEDKIKNEFLKGNCPAHLLSLKNFNATKKTVDNSSIKKARQSKALKTNYFIIERFFKSPL
ncbi:hypothetical protein [Psychroserpens algicola]|uniref:hypothetical protein n=1 Tax=Psychroserpens algicola TaxID=1719034 RepID=UPI0019538C4D|nr:hypothetical protein [Psychroserpens algicola]